MNYLKITNIEAYNISLDLSNKILDLVQNWNYLAQKTIGIQIIRSTDSISANIAEGFGRYHKKDKIKFYHIARASTIESFDWLEKSMTRELIDEHEYEISRNELDKLPKSINSLIKYTTEKLTI